MKSLLVTLIVGLVLAHGARAQTSKEGATPANARAETPSPGAQSSELAEADRPNREVVGPYDKLVAGALFNLGELYTSKRKYDAAEPFYKRALTILDKSPAVDAPLMSKVLTALGF